MADSTRSQRGSRRLSPFSSVVTLALWRWRQTGFLMSIIALGMIAAVLIAGAIPLFSDVMSTAGLRTTLRSTPDDSEIMATANVVALSSASVAAVHDQFQSLVKPALGSFVQDPEFSFVSGDLSFATPSKEDRSLIVSAVNTAHTASHVAHLKGQMAATTNTQANTIDVMLTPLTAKRLGVKIGSTIPLYLNYYAKPQPGPYSNDPAPPQRKFLITGRVVGTFDIDPANSAYWHGNTFQPTSSSAQGHTAYSYNFMVSEDRLLSIIEQVLTLNKANGVFSTLGAYSCLWSYHLNPSMATVGNLDNLINQLALLQNQYQANYGDSTFVQDAGNTFPYVSKMDLQSTLFSYSDSPSNLERFRSRISVAQIPAAVLTIMIMVLILFFVSLMTNLLVDRQSEAIAVLRSRGASSSQIFWALMTQCIGLGILALLIGLPLAVFLIVPISGRILPQASRDALNVITNSPLAALERGIWYALAVILVVWLTMSLSIFGASRSDVLAIRRQSSRSNKRPLWQRLNLDVIAAIIALAGYGVSYYLTSLSNVIQGDAKTLIATPLSIIAPFFLIVGLMFLFLRVFPLLLRLMASIVTRGRGAVSMLALAQIGRTPRQSIRMTLLLALATAFALFTLVYMATQAQHIQDISIYQVGADISGETYTQVNMHDPAKLTSRYTSVPGVISASSGYQTQAVGGRGGGITMELRAVDSRTFGSTVIWPSQQEAQKGDALLKQLLSKSSFSIKLGVVPVIIDRNTANALLLHNNSDLTVRINGLNVSDMTCVVVGIVPHIPTINDRIAVGGKGSIIPGGVLMDYTTYTTIYNNKLHKANKSIVIPDVPAINHVWLHTKSDDASLISVRTALKQPQYGLQNMQDRWQILASLNTDPLYLILTGLMIVGTITALLLALVGDLLASWLSARMRLTNFAILRAIGTTPREVASMLTWEQAIVYSIGLLLGVGFGLVLANTMIPALSFTDLNSTLANNDQLYSLQSAFPTRIIFPSTLIWALVALIGLYAIALITMVSVVSRPTLGQALRLNED
ncbi:FtsX-like permease family protein [Dictyobacter halimunensis]|uniref:FtsX-like permease family protein n=1 Tax=Dictyobacter halimunensis TaxID=3026934 RepID=UPI0030C6E1C8